MASLEIHTSSTLVLVDTHIASESLLWLNHCAACLILPAKVGWGSHIDLNLLIVLRMVDGLRSKLLPWGVNSLRSIHCTWLVVVHPVYLTVVYGLGDNVRGCKVRIEDVGLVDMISWSAHAVV